MIFYWLKSDDNGDDNDNDDDGGTLEGASI